MRSATAAARAGRAGASGGGQDRQGEPRQGAGAPRAGEQVPPRASTSGGARQGREKWGEVRARGMDGGGGAGFSCSSSRAEALIAKRRSGPARRRGRLRLGAAATWRDTESMAPFPSRWSCSTAMLWDSATAPNLASAGQAMLRLTWVKPPAAALTWHVGPGGRGLRCPARRRPACCSRRGLFSHSLRSATSSFAPT